MAVWAVQSKKRRNIALCSRCVMYSGLSAWAEQYEEQIAGVGKTCLQVATDYQNTSTRTPQVNEQGQMDEDSCKRFLVGVVVTSRVMRKMMGGTGGPQRTVSAPEDRSADRAE